MSTNKTPNYGLHAWEAGDDFLRTEFNENFAALDESLRMAFGSYTGDGGTMRRFPLGRVPRVVWVCGKYGEYGSYTNVKAGLMAPGYNLGNGDAAYIEGDELVINNSVSNCALNNKGLIYYYLVIF